MFKFKTIFLIFIFSSIANLNCFAEENERILRAKSYLKNWDECANLYRKIKNDKNLIVINKEKWQKFCFNAVNIGEKYFPQERGLAQIYENLGWLSWNLKDTYNNKSEVNKIESYFLSAISKYDFLRRTNKDNNRDGWLLKIRFNYSQLSRLMSIYDFQKSVDYINKSQEVINNFNSYEDPKYNRNVYFDSKKKEETFNQINQKYSFRDQAYLAYLYKENNQLTNARETFDKLIPNNNCVNFGTWNECLIALDEKAIIYYDLGLKKESIEIVNHVISVLDNYEFNNEKSLNFNLSRYCYFLKNGIYVSNKEAKNKFLDSCLQNIDLLNWRGKQIISDYYLDNSQYKLAIDIREKAQAELLSLYPRNHISVILNGMRIGEIYLIDGYYDLAAKAFKNEFDNLRVDNISYLENINRYKMLYFGSLLGSAKDEKAILDNLAIVEDIIRFNSKSLLKNAPLLTLEERLSFLKTASFQESDNLIYSIGRNFSSWEINPISEKLLTEEVVQAINSLNLLARINRKGLLEEIERRQSLLINSNEEVNSLKNQLNKIYDQLVNENDKKIVQKFKNKKARLEKKLYKKLPSFEVNYINQQEIFNALSPKSILIDFKKYQPYEKKEIKGFEFSSRSRYSALIVIPSGKIYDIDIGDSELIDSEIENLLEKIEFGDDHNIHLEKLSEFFLEPLEKYFDQYSEVFLSLDSKLNYIPINLLRDNSDNSFYHKDYDFRIISSPRELISLNNEIASKNQSKVLNSVVLANPDFNSFNFQDSINKENSNLYSKDFKRSGANCQSKWGSLPKTKEEGLQIKNLLSAKLYSEGEASEKNLKSLNFSPAILHIATHGFYCLSDNIFDNPLLSSGIVLSGANNQNQNISEDGYFTALEFTKLDLSNTELVVLSSCESALGEDEIGEGIMGLRRSLSVAGAKSSILSLWKVDDDATAKFMELFYEKLKRGESRKKALEQTQEEFRNGLVKSKLPGIDWSEEYYWGAFQLSGDWRAFQFNQ